VKAQNIEYALCMLLLTLAAFADYGKNPANAPDTTETQEQVKPGSDTSGTWLIPFDQVISSGSGTDVIPVLTQPGFYPLWEAGGEGYLDKWDMVISMRVGQTVKAYPHSILN